MSRCFPYPPPGYTPSRSTNEALIESIKLQKEDVEKAKALADLAKAQRKKEKKEKKEKKREKKEKKKLKEEEKAKQSKSIQLDKDVRGSKTSEHGNGGIPQKQIKDDAEPLEKSNITEEHGEPSQAPAYSSDSTQSGKRKRPATEQVPNARALGGNILRIRLPSQKNMKHEISRPNVEQQPILKPAENLSKQDVVGFKPSRPREAENQVKFEIRGRDEQPCSTSGRKDVPPEQVISLRRADHDNIRLVQPSAGPQRVVDQKLKNIAPTTVTRHDDTSHVEYVRSGSSSEFKKKRKLADKYRDLIENWNPPSMFMDTEEDDWLSGSKKDVNRPEKMVMASTEKSCSGSSSLWPQACFLPEANIYAMPYAIPF